MPATDIIAWSKPSIYSEGTGVHHGYATAKAPELSGSWSNPERPEDGPVAKIVKGWYTKLDSGGFIVPHVDQGPWVERWHYPISGKGYVWAEWDYHDPVTGQVLGHWGPPPFTTLRYYERYRMNHHLPHAVYNPFDEPRIILIVEYDNPINQPTTGLIICPMIPEIQTMIDAI